MKSSSFDRPHWSREVEIVDEIYESDEFHMPVHYIFSLTHKCNLHCPFCFLRKIKGEKTMTADDWLTILDELPDYARVIMFGGEPLMFDDFDKVYLAAATKYRCSIVTNGTLLTPEKVDLILSAPKLTDLNVSVDSIGNWNRNFTEADWKQLTTRIALFNEKRRGHPAEPKLGISVVLLDETADELFDVHRLAHEELQCDFVNYCLLNGSPMQMADTMEPFESLYREVVPPHYKNWTRILEQIEAIRKYDRQHDYVAYLRPKIIDMNIDKYPTESLHFLNEAHFHQERFGPCKIPWADCRIQPDGCVTPCLSFPVGNVKDNGSLRSILNSEQAKRFKNEIKQAGFFSQCNRCVFLYDKQFDRTAIKYSQSV